MPPEQFGFNDMIFAWIFLAVPITLALFLGRMLERSRARDARRRDERDERDERDRSNPL